MFEITTIQPFNHSDGDFDALSANNVLIRRKVFTLLTYEMYVLLMRYIQQSLTTRNINSIYNE